MNLSLPVSRRCKSLLVHLGIVVPLLVVAAAPAPPQATSFADSMLTKLTVGTGGDVTVGPYPEEGFLSGGRTALSNFHREVIDSMGSTADVYIAKLNEFDAQRYFNNLDPNRARDNWVRDFARLKELAGATP
jgi:hypothetical protein